MTCAAAGAAWLLRRTLCVLQRDNMCVAAEGMPAADRNIAGRTYVVRLAWPCKRCHIRFEAMNNFTKYLIYLLAVAIVLVVMLLLKDNISLWLSRVFHLLCWVAVGTHGRARRVPPPHGGAAAAYRRTRRQPLEGGLPESEHESASSYNSKFNLNLNPETESYAENTNQKTPT